MKTLIELFIGMLILGLVLAMLPSYWLSIIGLVGLILITDAVFKIGKSETKKQ